MIDCECCDRTHEHGQSSPNVSALSPTTRISLKANRSANHIAAKEVTRYVSGTRERTSLIAIA